MWLSKGFWSSGLTSACLHYKLFSPIAWDSLLQTGRTEPWRVLRLGNCGLPLAFQCRVPASPRHPPCLLKPRMELHRGKKTKPPLQCPTSCSREGLCQKPSASKQGPLWLIHCLPPLYSEPDKYLITSESSTLEGLNKIPTSFLLWVTSTRIRRKNLNLSM